ncbi:MAG: cation:proton antiporter [Paludibacter sp.]|nr:cation:proton antiporter [Paludibacter sp.]
MTSTIIITLCILLLLAYLFDLTSSRTKIPSVILLLLLGWLLHQTTDSMNIHLPDFSKVLPVLGSIGLILIVLEGSLELDLDKSKISLIRKSFLGALIPMFALAFLLSFLFQYLGGYPFKSCLVSAIPFSIISSAIAIPSVRSIGTADKEFVIYESSFSDILGVIFFNFIVLNENFGFNTFRNFTLQLIIIVIISFFATIGLTILLRKIEHHIKFIPIILLVILIYTVSEMYKLPSLIFILSFGLFVGNLYKFKRFKWIQKLRPEELKSENQKFQEITIEGAFLVRALFFLLFGYLLETAEIINNHTLFLSVALVFIIFSVRIIQLKLSRLPLKPLLFVAPRGLITILLFLSIMPNQHIVMVNKSLIVQVIILTALIMMFGLMLFPEKTKPNDERVAEEIKREVI